MEELISLNVLQFWDSQPNVISAETELLGH